MQHLAYQTLLPTVNKYLQQKWDKASFEMHLSKVKSAKPTIDTTAPKTYGHLAQTKKKREDQSMSKIQRENNMLLEKISHIRRTTGRINNKNDYENKRERQQQERLRITKENELALLRLNQCQPHYSIYDWQEDWRKTLKLMENISHYPQKVTDTKRQGQASNKSSNTGNKEKDSVDAEHHLNSSLGEGRGQASNKSGNIEPKEEVSLDEEHHLNSILIPKRKGESEEETEESDQQHA